MSAGHCPAYALKSKLSNSNTQSFQLKKFRNLLRCRTRVLAVSRLNRATALATSHAEKLLVEWSMKNEFAEAAGQSE